MKYIFAIFISLMTVPALVAQDGFVPQKHNPSLYNLPFTPLEFVDFFLSDIISLTENYDYTTAKILRVGINALSSKNIEQAIAIRDLMPINTLDRHILTWAIATSGLTNIPSTELYNAMTELREWPGNQIIQKNFERSIAYATKNPKQIIDFFQDSKPITTQGVVALSQALKQTGNIAQAKSILLPWWHQMRLDAQEEQFILDRVGQLLTIKDHNQRMKAMLLLHRLRSAEHAAKLAKAQPFYNNFVAILRDMKKGKKKTATVNAAWRNDPVLQFAQIQHLRRTKQYAKAVQLMLKVPQESEKLIDLDVWWTERRVLSREMLDLNEPELAYKLVANYMSHNPITTVDAEFHAGWYALRFLKQNKKAILHFVNIIELSSRPISLARGYYWLGRSFLAEGDQQNAIRCLQNAARYGTTFYGQLSAAKLGQKTFIYHPEANNDEKQQFERRDVVQAIKRLEKLGYREQTGNLYLELATQLNTPKELAMLAIMAESQGDYYISLKIGKNAVLRGINVGALSHPIGAIPNSAPISATEKALSYAVARQESEFNFTSLSKAGARGMLQLMPRTAKSIAKKHQIIYSAQKLATDAEYNAILGTHFLNEELKRSKGSYLLTFASYNAGGRRVNEWIKRYGDPRSFNIDDVVDWIERIPYPETRNYVMRTMENYQIYKAYLTGTSDIQEDLSNVTMPPQHDANSNDH